jgi:hypothetical protein
MSKTTYGRNKSRFRPSRRRHITVATIHQRTLGVDSHYITAEYSIQGGSRDDTTLLTPFHIFIDVSLPSILDLALAQLGAHLVGILNMGCSHSYDYDGRFLDL